MFGWKKNTTTTTTTTKNSMADILCEDILNSKFFTEILIHHMERTAIYIYWLKENPHIKWLYGKSQRMTVSNWLKIEVDFLKRFNNHYELDKGTCLESTRFWREGQCCFLKPWESLSLAQLQSSKSWCESLEVKTPWRTYIYFFAFPSFLFLGWERLFDHTLLLFFTFRAMIHYRLRIQKIWQFFSH